MAEAAEVVGPVLPGSLVILRGPTWWVEDADGTLDVDIAQAGHLIDQITKVAGHDRFVVVHVLDDAIQLVGPEELLELVRTIGRSVIEAEDEVAAAERKVAAAERRATKAGKQQA